jgi:hypothetical protein
LRLSRLDWWDNSVLFVSLPPLASSPPPLTSKQAAQKIETHPSKYLCFNEPDQNCILLIFQLLLPSPSWISATLALAVCPELFLNVTVAVVVLPDGERLL